VDAIAEKDFVLDWAGLRFLGDLFSACSVNKRGREGSPEMRMRKMKEQVFRKEEQGKVCELERDRL
jgi:hypothetical protein